jgi:hypothetical protein
MAFGNGPRLVTTGLDLLVDAADKQSYPGSGTTWTDLKSRVTGSLTGSISFTTEFYGGLTFADSSSAIIFPSNVINYGTGSFTVEMAFKPTFINGRHYLMSENSGSFPNWAIYLSGSAGAGKLWSEFRISSTVSCSVSSSTTFVTGSVYQVDVRIAPAFSASSIYLNGIAESIGFGNNGGSLTNTASLFVGNYSQNNTQNFSGSIYTIKAYSQSNTLQPVVNFNATSTRFSKQPVPDTARKQFDYLVVAGGGGGSWIIGGGGGAGGLLTGTAYLTNYTSQIVVGSGGATNTTADVNAFNGSNSILGSITALGGGGAGGSNVLTGSNGGSGGGGGYGSTSPGFGTPGQGNNGSTGGGGGAGTPAIGLRGGSGSYVANFAAIGGSPAGWFAGGGGGSTFGGDISGGIGGGGSGSLSGGNGTAGITNTGGGAGGGWSGGGPSGGSGIVAIRYSGGPIAIGGEITQSAGYTYHVFRTVGTSSFTIF